MKLIFDTDTSQLIVAEGFASPVALLEAKRGTGAKIQLMLLRDGQAWTAPALSQFRFIVKPWGKYEVDQTCADGGVPCHGGHRLEPPSLGGV